MIILVGIFSASFLLCSQPENISMTTIQRSTRVFALAAVLLGVSLSAKADAVDPTGPWYPSPNGGAPLTTGQELFASGGDVTLTFLGPTGAAYDEQLFVYSPANGLGLFFDNHATANGATIDLGTYAAGTEIEFGIYVVDTGDTFYDGPGSRNVDGDVHAYMVNNYEGLPDTTYVGFEDLNGNTGSDWNYIDEVYAFTGVSAAIASVPDASSTAMLLGLGAISLFAFARRSQGKQAV
jgi:hypothetical protein